MYQCLLDVLKMMAPMLQMKIKKQIAKQKNIGISQLVEHPSLDKAKKGFIKALEDKGYKDGDNIKIDFQNAQMICLLHKVLLVSLYPTKRFDICYIYSICTSSL